MSETESDINPFFLNASVVEILPATANQEKASTLGGASPIQTNAHVDRTSLKESVSR